jgi:hypothetical protein
VDMRTHFRTHSGSEYIVDDAALTWKRLSHNLASNGLRTEEGLLFSKPEISIHKPVFLVGQPFLAENGESTVRIVRTTEVVEIWIEQ